MWFTRVCGAPRRVLPIWKVFFREPLEAVAKNALDEEAHQGAEAAAEFQKILNHRSIVVSDPVDALAHLQLGRALAMAGQTAKAKAAYSDVLALWKDADAGLPILQQAKAAYAKP